MSFWDAAHSLEPATLAFLIVALVVAFGFEFINGFHDTANAVTTVIYTRTLKPTPAVIYSGTMNFLGVLFGVTVIGYVLSLVADHPPQSQFGVAFGIVHLLPVDLLIEGSSGQALVMVLSLLLAGVIWNLGTWYLGLPVSSSHTLIGSILGVGLANSLLLGKGTAGVDWTQAGKVLLGLVISPAVGFGAAYVLLLVMKATIREKRLYEPPAHADDRPPIWIRAILIFTCGGVSFAHGSNDGQKGMGLILLVLIGFLPFHYAMDLTGPEKAEATYNAAVEARAILEKDPEATPNMMQDVDRIAADLRGKESLQEVSPEARWATRQSIYRFEKEVKESLSLSGETRSALKPRLQTMSNAIEFVPMWVVIGVAVALGVGTTIGYKRIVITVAEKIGKTHLTYAQGAAAELVAAATILLADVFKKPVSTTHVLSSGVAGTMAANGSGVQGGTCQKIALAWLLTMPAAMTLSGLLFTVGSYLFVSGR
jgi:inorganic phosphate transporter, PiT family